MNLLLAAAAAQTPLVRNPDQIRQVAREVIARPEFQLDRPSDEGGGWAELFLRLFIEIIKPIARFFSALWDISPALAWFTAIALTVVLILLVVHIVYTLRTALAQRLPQYASSERDRPMSLEHFQRQAAEAAAQGDYITAVRLLFKASLLRLEQAERRPARPGTTNRELLRRYQQSGVANHLQSFVEVIDTRWYAGSPCSEADYQRCRDAHSHLLAAAGG